MVHYHLYIAYSHRCEKAYVNQTPQIVIDNEWNHNLLIISVIQAGFNQYENNLQVY